MKSYFFVLAFLLVSLISQAAGHKQYRAAPAANPSALVSPRPAEIRPPFVTLGSGTGSNVGKAFALEALELMNRAYYSDCLLNETLDHTFVSLNSVVTPVLDRQDVAGAYARYVAGAPYALDLRWYKPFLRGKVIGYTYNWMSDTGGAPHVSETRIYTNTKQSGLDSAKDYASHLAHELSHQARAGGFVHYTVFDGSGPYEFGKIMAKCIQAL